MQYIYANKRPIHSVGMGLMKLSEEEMRNKYLGDEALNSQWQNEIWKSFGKGIIDEFRPYLEDLFHETNSYGCTVQNTINNLFWYRENKPDQVENIEGALFRRYNLFIRGLQNIEVFYNEVFTNRIK